MKEEKRDKEKSEQTIKREKTNDREYNLLRNKNKQVFNWTT